MCPAAAASVVYPTSLSFLGVPCSSRSSSGLRSFQNGTTWALENLPSCPTSSESTIAITEEAPSPISASGAATVNLSPADSSRKASGTSLCPPPKLQGPGAELSQECFLPCSSCTAAQDEAVGFCSSANIQFWGDSNV